MPLIAYNVYLNTSDVRIAKKIAAAVRFGGGGYRYVKALGFEIRERGIVQVSMNLVNYKGTPIFRVFETIKREAARYGVNVVSSEIVGLTPADAMLDVSDFYLQLENFNQAQVLENRLLDLEKGADKSLHDLLNEFASSSPAPGGGSASALAGSLAAALSAMVCNLTIGKVKYETNREALTRVLERSGQLRNELEELIIADSESFDAVMQAMKLPKSSPAEIETRDKKLGEAYRKATAIPLSVMEKSLEVLELSAVCAEKGNVNSVSDAGVSSLLAKAALEGAYLNVMINLPSLTDKTYAAEVESKTRQLTVKSEQLHRAVLEKVKEQLGCPKNT